jgi:hypothetical protein
VPSQEESLPSESSPSIFRNEKQGSESRWGIFRIETEHRRTVGVPKQNELLSGRSFAGVFRNEKQAVHRLRAVFRDNETGGSRHPCVALKAESKYHHNQAEFITARSHKTFLGKAFPAVIRFS